MTGLPRVTYSNIGTDFSPLHDWLDAALPAFRRDRLGRDRANRIGARDDREGTAYAAASPIDRELRLGDFTAASAAAVGRAVASAATACADWSRRAWPERVALLRQVADRLDAAKYDIGMACLLEVGKSRLEAIGEAEECVDLVRYYCDEMEANDGFVRPLRRAIANEETRDLLRPLGVFGVIAPFNFPAALSVNMLTGAILTGNTAVYKPSPLAGLTGALVTAAFEEVLPPGVINLVCGDAATGAALAAEPRLAGIAFTGSHAVGMTLVRRFATGPWARPAIVEMGGKNPAYVAASADLEVAAQGVMRSAFGLQGQKCSACSKVYVAQPVAEAFLERLVSLTRGLRIGNPEQREVFLGPLIDARAAARFEDAVAQARHEGRVLTGGERLAGGLFDRGAYVAPTIATGLAADHRLQRDELFLPLLTVQTFSTLAEAIADGNRVAYGLTAGIYSSDEAELARFLERADAGVLYANRASGATTGAWPGIQSFCGWKGSGASGKGGLGPHYLSQFMREQSQTVFR